MALYLHRRSSDLPPAIGAIVAYDGSDDELAKGVAMHIAAARPQYRTRDEVPGDVLENERRIAEATAREEGKPEQVLPTHRRGPDQRLLQGRRAAGAGLGRRSRRRP